MKVTVVHDDQGEIVSIAHVGDLAQAGSKFTRAGLLPGEGQTVVEVELSEEQAALPLRELHTSCRIEPGSSTLVQKSR
jgi:hypothetical protein